MSDETKTEPTPSEIMQGLGAAAQAAGKLIGDVFQGMGDALSTAVERLRQWADSPEGQRVLRQYADEQYIRRLAKTELRAGRREIRQMFDDLYDELGLER